MPLVSPEPTEEERRLEQLEREQNIDYQVAQKLRGLIEWFQRRQKPSPHPTFRKVTGKLLRDVWEASQGPRKRKR